MHFHLASHKARFNRLRKLTATITTTTKREKSKKTNETGRKNHSPKINRPRLKDYRMYNYLLKEMKIE